MTTNTDAARLLGPNGTPVIWMVDEYAEVCARHADALAAEAEAIAREVMAQIDELGRGDLFAAIRRAFGMRAALRGLACQLGELHTVLDELAHYHRGGGAS